MEGHRLQFQNINLYIGNKQILHDVSGMAEPGKLLVIMGPSGKYMSARICIVERIRISYFLTLSHMAMFYATTEQKFIHFEMP